MGEAYELPARLDLSNVSGLHDDLLARKEQDIVLDFAEVTHFGALPLQLVIAVACHAQATGKKFTLKNVHDRVVEQLKNMGVTPETIMEGQT